jgi:hypothetical protein
MEVGRYPYVKRPLVGFGKILSDRPAKLEIIFDGLFEACLELIHGTALEGNQVVDAFDPAVKTLIIRAFVSCRYQGQQFLTSSWPGVTVFS